MSFLLDSSPIKKEIYPLTSFRFIVAFVVFLFHCRIHFGFLVGIKFIDKFIVNGAVFMTGFFVLSGYIMSYVYYEKDFSNKNSVFEFYLKRFAKIYPVYFIGTVVYFIFISPQAPYIITDWIRIAINDLFVIQGFFPGMFQLGINGGTWSISVEVFFYFLFPLLIQLTRGRPYTLIFIGLLMTLVININILSVESHHRSSFYSNPIM